MPEPTAIHHLHAFALEAANRLSIRSGKAQDPQHMWAYSTGAAAAWAFHQALERLSEIDPEGAAAFASDLAEELEDGDYGDQMADAARDHGLNPTPWFDSEHNA